MPEVQRRVVIVDYGMGNLFSVRQACSTVGLSAAVSSSKRDVLEADVVILPGVGAYGDAMDTLTRLDLVEPLRDVSQAGTPFVGICLGLQLMMTESEEFGRHRGLGLIEGPVVRLSRNGGVKVPQVGWNRIERPPNVSWARSPLDGVQAGAHFYFVHSYCVVPADPATTLSTTTYGDTPFCSSLMRGNMFGCQFHPERSGPTGLVMYRHLAAWCTDRGRRPERRNA